MKNVHFAENLQKKNYPVLNVVGKDASTVCQLEGVVFAPNVKKKKIKDDNRELYNLRRLLRGASKATEGKDDIRRPTG